MLISSAVSNFILVAPLCVLLVGLCFMLYWLQQRQYGYLLWFSVSAMLAGSSLLLLSLISPVEIYRWAFWLGFMYLGTYVCLMQALCQRFATQISWRFCLLVVTVVQIGILYYALIDNQLNVRIAIGGLGFIAICVHRLPAIYRAVSQHHIDQWLKRVFYLLLGYLLLREAFLLQMLWQHAAPLDYQQTLFGFVIQLASLFFLWLFSVFFLVSNIKDRLNVLSTERNMDALTGLTNRRCFFECADQYFQHGLRRQSALFMCDLDHFKQINDSYGHQVGDQVLQVFADAVRSALREKDILARIGGEEFVGILYDVDLPQALSIVQRIKEVIRTPIMLDNAADIQITASFGLVLLNDFGSIEDAIKAADHLMYQAKAAGRNNVQYVLP